MGIFSRFLRSSPPREERAMTVGPQSLKLELPFSGERVTPSTATRNTAVARAVELISNDLAKVPRRLMRRTANGAELDNSSKLWRLFDRSPNVEQSGFEWMRMMTSTYLLYGNAFAYIQKSGRGEVLQMIPLDPTSISAVVDQDTGTFHYEHADLGMLEPEEVLPLAFGQKDSSGVLSQSPIDRARESL